MQLHELEEQLKRMREQSADDYTEVLWSGGDDFNLSSIRSIQVFMPPSHSAKRVIVLRNRDPR